MLQLWVHVKGEKTGKRASFSRPPFVCKGWSGFWAWPEYVHHGYGKIESRVFIFSFLITFSFLLPNFSMNAALLWIHDECFWWRSMLCSCSRSAEVVGDDVVPSLPWAIAALCIAFEIYFRVRNIFLSLLFQELIFLLFLLLSSFSFLITIIIFVLLLHLTFCSFSPGPQDTSGQLVFSQGFVCNITGYSLPLGKKRNVLFKTVPIYACYRYACYFPEKSEVTGWCQEHLHSK